jgi:putative transposase
VARVARFVAPGPPRHVTRRGNRRETVFFSDADHELYRDLSAQRTRGHGVEVWSHCPVPDHVRLILVQTARERLGRALGEAHRRRGAVVNARPRVTGHLFQSRFGSAAMDEEHLMAAARYVALEPARARLVARADDWRWSSARAHLRGRDDGLATVQPPLDRCGGRFADLIDTLPPLGDHGRAPRRRNDRSAAGFRRFSRRPRRPRGGEIHAHASEGRRRGIGVE